MVSWRCQRYFLGTIKKIVVPIFLGAFALAVLISPSVTILRFGDDATIGLGRNPQRIRLFASITILLLSGLSVALVGSVSFVGLVVPHVMRTVSGEKLPALDSVLSVRRCAPRFGGRFNRSNGESAF